MSKKLDQLKKMTAVVAALELNAKSLGLMPWDVYLVEGSLIMQTHFTGNASLRPIPVRVEYPLGAVDAYCEVSFKHWAEEKSTAHIRPRILDIVENVTQYSSINLTIQNGGSSIQC